MSEEEAKQLKEGDKLHESEYNCTLIVESVKERGVVMIIEQFDKYGPHRHFRDFASLKSYTKKL